jgi:hypothetical protein
MTAKPYRNGLARAALGLLLLSATGASAGSPRLELAASDARLAEPSPAGANTVRIGTLRDGDPIHRGSGTARLLKLPDGAHVVRFETLEVVPGPDLFVYLVAHEDPLFPEDVTAGFHNLGPLKSRFGDQNYTVPESVELAAYGSVVVWCNTFKVQFAVAALE